MSGIQINQKFPSVSSMTQEAQDFVEDLLVESRLKATEAVDTANDVINDLRDAKAPDKLPDPPKPPVITSAVTGSINTGFGGQPNFGDITITLPAGFTPDQIEVPDIAKDIPLYTPLFTTFGVPEAPELIIPEMPVAPSVRTDFDVPDAPIANYGDIPDLAAITMPVFVMPTLEAFDDAAPTFGATVPNESMSWSEPAYQGKLANTLQAALQEMLNGGTGIAAPVERALWERDRQRIDATTAKGIQEAAETWASRGFPLPPGALVGAVLDAQRDAAGKVAEQSRSVAIAQADLEQKNRQFAVEQGIAFENLFVQMHLQIAQRAFEMARFTVEMRIQIFNAQVAAFNVEQAIYAQKIERFKVKLQYALAQLDAYKAQLEAAQVTAEINKELIGAFNAKVQAFSAQVQAFDSLVRAASTRAELEKNKVELYRAQVEGRAGELSARKSVFDAYVARVQGESAKADLEKSNAGAYSARVGALTALADVTLKGVDAKLAVSNQRLQYGLGELQRLGQLAQMQLGAIQARQGAFSAETQRASVEFEAKRSTEQLNIQTTIENGRTLIAYYQAEIAKWTANVQQIIEFAKINSTSIQAAGQIASNLAAGSMAGTSVSAGFQGGVSRGETTSEQFGYSESKQEQTSTADNHNTNINIDGTV